MAADDLPLSASIETAGLLRFDEHEIRARGPGHLVAVCFRQWRTERALARRGIEFRTVDPAAASAAYAAMTADEFEAVNGRQDWANWRTIPRSMSGLVPNRPLRVVDLGCGCGGSTRVLAHYAPAGSLIVGYELAEPLLNVAARGDYRHASGERVHVEFRRQSVTETLCTPEAALIKAESLDLANSSGVVGYHLHAEGVRVLARELKRVLAPAGLAMLDVGPAVSAATLTEVMTSAGLECIRRTRSCLLDPRGQLVFRKH